MKVKDHRDLVRNPAFEKRLPFIRRNPDIEGCWAVAYKKIPHLIEKLCLNYAREGKLTCKVHAHLEDRARMLKRAQGDERLQNL